MQVDDTAGAGGVTPAEVETETDEPVARVALRPVKIPASLADPARLAEARRRFEETTVAGRRIAIDLGFPPATLARYALDARWSRPKGAPSRQVGSGGRPRKYRRLAVVLEDAREVSAHLLRAVDRQIMKIEARAKKAGTALEERDARMLAALARTLHTLMALDRDEGAKTKAPEPVDRDTLDADLVRKITRWAESGQGPE